MEELVLGWQSQPNTLGTLDIIHSCITTILLCRWSCVCPNVPRPDITTSGSAMLQIRWQLFTILFPEVTVAIAGEQWESSNQGWSHRRAFFADMGGILLKAPEFPAFPVDCQQLAYLVENRYVKMPSISERDITDRNKADGPTRLLAVCQIIWFTIQCIGREVQGLGLSTLELTTLTFILCTLNMYFFWAFKPRDVQSPIMVLTDNTLDAILLNAGDKARQPYSRTPLDFIKPPQHDKMSLNSPFWLGVNSIVHVDEDPGRRPIRYIGNDKTMPPMGIDLPKRLYGIMLEIIYSGLHFFGVLLEFPSLAERYLWVASSSALAIVVILYLLAVYMGHSAISPLPRWASLALHGSVILVYAMARMYILVEGFVGLRVLPAKLYICVEWLNFLPHP
ncbi:hypothetical protein GGR53DRAFT_523784 [Hypoxylon sp. FL1150]|nr:hypothetical protein GGR53DRAFT_523784 [Hypoxylon sp. FL1150]